LDVESAWAGFPDRVQLTRKEWAAKRRALPSLIQSHGGAAYWHWGDAPALPNHSGAAQGAGHVEHTSTWASDASLPHHAPPVLPVPLAVPDGGRNRRRISYSSLCATDGDSLSYTCGGVGGGGGGGLPHARSGPGGHFETFAPMIQVGGSIKSLSAWQSGQGDWDMEEE
jgi:hypothetical protein